MCDRHFEITNSDDVSCQCKSVEETRAGIYRLTECHVLYAWAKCDVRYVLPDKSCDNSRKRKRRRRENKGGVEQLNILDVDTSEQDRLCVCVLVGVVLLHTRSLTST